MPLPRRRALQDGKSLYFDEDFKRLRKDKMERQLRQEEQEGELRLQMLQAQVEELNERKLLHRQMRHYYEKAEAKLDLDPKAIPLPSLPTLLDEQN